MPKLVNTINVGEIIALVMLVINLLTILVAFAYKAGFIQRTLESLWGAFNTLKLDFDAHTKSDSDRFDAIDRNIVDVATSLKKT